MKYQLDAPTFLITLGEPNITNHFYKISLGFTNLPTFMKDRLVS